MSTSITRRAVLDAAAVAALKCAPASEPALPRVKLGKHLVSRLICGNNCFTGNSHPSAIVGMYDRLLDQPSPNAALARHYGGPPSGSSAI